MGNKPNEPSSGELLDRLTECFVEASRDLPAEALREELRAAGSDPERVLGRVNRLVNEASAPTPDRARWERWSWRPLAWALAALVAVLVPVSVYQWIHWQRRGVTQEQRLSQAQAQIAELRQRIEALTPSGPPAAATARAAREEKAALEQALAQQAQTIHELRQRLEKSARPRPDAAWVVALTAPRSDDPAQTIVLGPAKRFLILQVHLSKAVGDYPAYKLVIKDRQDRVISRADPARQEEDRFTHLLAQDALRPGDYKLEIYGKGPGTEPRLAQWRFRIVLRSDQ